MTAEKVIGMIYIIMFEKGVVKRLTVTMPVSFRDNVLRHKNHNRKTIDDTGFVTFTIGHDHHRCICLVFRIST